MLTQALEGARAKVTAVASAPEALEALQRESVDLLLSDIALPGMDGYELIRRIREAGHSARELPAIALTAFAGREDRRRALLAGYQIHLSKPVDQNELFVAIASLAGH
ncbi:MAG: response regulator [Cellvibrionaceae bacterium]